MIEPSLSRDSADGHFLQIKSIVKTYDDVVAVNDVSLDIAKGDIFALLGASGSGKSTLLRMLAGFETPNSGQIILDGEDIVSLAPYRRPINMMFQSYALFPHMTVEQNIAYGLKQDRMPKNLIADKVVQMLRLVHMEKYAKRKPEQLSGGQRQRVALARSLAKSPKLLLLDEPMGALDKKLRNRMQLEVVDILESVGVTCVMVTHDQEEAMTMANRIAIMEEGRIVQAGTPRDIYEAPNSLQAAEFIGSMNLFHGTITVDAQDHAVIQTTEVATPMYVSYGVTTAIEDKQVVFAVRPEKTLISRDQPDSQYNWCHGVVHDIAYLGGHSVYHIRLDNGKIVYSFMINSDRFADLPTWEESVYVHWSDDSGLVLRP
ncbi:polyamine ABC transporter ATP-binding protein [Marinomonas ostreistagni]|uniref:Spermidine/putrescine import ATP-binding protein PotA n=1 Tax=Marinomonas ostreistagni TaxID=359209 RepID=A0ABS0Z809_9GAMM|nr:polyamine ABC transporter ATP-binding protein [Marinomonas ostreistagni]MBJ7549797.1 polyamine ABC transporter ATP-binding protein [Marinomonas ostreistagni]